MTIRCRKDKRNATERNCCHPVVSETIGHKTGDTRGIKHWNTAWKHNTDTQKTGLAYMTGVGVCGGAGWGWGEVT